VRRWLESENRPDDVVKIIVADSGPGVPPEDSERIFDPFFTHASAGQGHGPGTRDRAAHRRELPGDRLGPEGA
jgi:signal transduction histidine kinase